MTEYTRIPNESFEDFFVRIFENRNVYGLTCEEAADILNRESGHSYTESKWRKDFKRFQQGRIYERKRINNDVLDGQARELEKQRIRLAEQRAALKRAVREEARNDAWRDEIRESFLQVETMQPHEFYEIFDTQDGTLVVMLTDWHVGIEFDNAIGKYNAEIARDRVYQYISKVHEACVLYHPKKCIVALGGDMISGIIHNTLRIESREDVIQQTKLAAELVCEFVSEIAGCFDEVDMYGVGGNHSRVAANKEDALVGEMLDDIIPFYAQARLGTCKNVHIHADSGDKTVETFFIENNTAVLVHGDYDDMSDASIGKLERRVGGVIDVILLGHMHENEFCDHSGVHVIRGGCLCGSGDGYCTQKRLTGKPSQSMAYFNSKGELNAVLPVYFE